MSLHISMVCLHGYRISDIERLLTQMPYRLVEPPLAVTTSADMERLLHASTNSVNRVVKASYSVEEWTYLLDHELVVMWQDDILQQYSKETGARIFAWVCEGISGSYGFRLFDPHLHRDFMTVEGEVVNDVGEPMIEEMGFDWTRADEDVIISLAAKVGFSV